MTMGLQSSVCAVTNIGSQFYLLPAYDAREARIYSARFVITWDERSTALVFVQIFPIRHDVETEGCYLVGHLT